MRRASGRISVVSTKANAADIVTSADIECQKTIEAVVRREFPNDVFLGEEDIGVGSLASADALRGALKDVSVGDVDDCVGEEERLDRKRR